MFPPRRLCDSGREINQRRFPRIGNYARPWWSVISAGNNVVNSPSRRLKSARERSLPPSSSASNKNNIIRRLRALFRSLPTRKSRSRGISRLGFTAGRWPSRCKIHQQVLRFFAPRVASVASRRRTLTAS